MEKVKKKKGGEERETERRMLQQRKIQDPFASRSFLLDRRMQLKMLFLIVDLFFSSPSPSPSFSLFFPILLRRYQDASMFASPAGFVFPAQKITNHFPCSPCRGIFNLATFSEVFNARILAFRLDRNRRFVPSLSTTPFHSPPLTFTLTLTMFRTFFLAKVLSESRKRKV